MKFLHFKTSAQSSRAVELDQEGPFRELSPALRSEIREEVLMPMLLEVKLFGHSHIDADDKLKVDALFASGDSDHSRSLDEAEVRS